MIWVLLDKIQSHNVAADKETGIEKTPYSYVVGVMVPAMVCYILVMSSFVLHKASRTPVSTIGNVISWLGRIHSFLRPAGGRAGRRYARERLSSWGRVNPGGLMGALPRQSAC